MAILAGTSFWREMRLVAVATILWFSALVIVALGYGIAYAKHSAALQTALSNAASWPSTVIVCSGSIVLIAFLCWRIPVTVGQSLYDLGLRAPRGRDWLVIATCLLALVAAKFVQGAVMLSTGNAHHQQAGFEHVHARDTAAAVGFFIATVFFAPFGEELLFRLMLFRTLAEKMPWGIAAVISALIFGAAHLDAVLFPILACVGFINAIAYRRTGNIVTSMILHGANNAVASAFLILS